jgi:GT2 family glycosyltransferase
MNKPIQIVLVLYKLKLQDSLTYQSLVKFINKTNINYDLLIYNNSPEVIVEKDDSYLLVNATSNLMLANAYNYALKLADDTNKKWLLLLDQDTALTHQFFTELDSFLNTDYNFSFAAVVPILFKKDTHLSPISYSPKLGPFYSFKPITINVSTKHCVSAYNSATMLDVEFMVALGGFSTDYPLDMLDHWYFYQIYKAKMPIFVLNAKIEQNLSLLDMSNSMNIERYEMYVKAQKKFVKELSFLAEFTLRFQLIKSLVSQIIIPRRRKFFKTTFYELIN